jgi:putative phosphoesterase
MRKINNISKIGVISDTHLSNYSGSMSVKITRHFQDAELIIHCGDIVNPKVITELESIAPVIAVRGNMDPEELNIPDSEVMLINNTHTVCVSHGSGSPYGIMQKLFKKFSTYNPSIILFGHTHIAGEFEFNGVRFFNPGSPTTRTEYFSVGIIDIKNKKLTTNIIVI